MIYLFYKHDEKIKFISLIKKYNNKMLCIKSNVERLYKKNSFFNNLKNNLKGEKNGL